MSRIYRTRPVVEAKVKAGSAGAGIGAAAGMVAVWAVDSYLWTPGVEGDLPAPVAGLVLAVGAAASAYVSGWLARHTPRPGHGGVEQ